MKHGLLLIRYPLWISVIVFALNLTAQEPYLNQVLYDPGLPPDFPPNYFFVDFFEVNENLKSSLLNQGWEVQGVETPVSVLQLDANGQALSGHIVYTPVGPLKKSTDYDVKGNRHVFPVQGRDTNPYNILFYTDFDNNNYWAKAIDSIDAGHFTKTSFINEELVISEYGPFADTDESTLRLVCLSAMDGSQMWSYMYEPVDTGTGIGTVYEIERSINNSVIVHGTITHLDANPDFLLKVDESGEELESILLEGFGGQITYEDISVDAFGNIFVGGKIFKDSTETYCGVPFPLNNYNYSAFIAKLNSSMELLWCKELIADNFTCWDMKISASPQGDVVFANSSHCELPIIAGKLSSNGVVEWVRGYEFPNPMISITENGSIGILTRWKYLSEGGGEFGTIIANILPDGELPSCPQFDACLNTEDLLISTQPLTWQRTHGLLLPDVAVQVSEVEVMTEPHCGSPPPPSPFFELPDTLCRGACPTPDTLRMPWLMPCSGK